MAVNKINQTTGTSHSHAPKGPSWAQLSLAKLTETIAQDTSVFDQAPFSRKPEPLADRTITNISGKKRPNQLASKEERVAHRGVNNAAKFF